MRRFWSEGSTGHIDDRKHGNAGYAAKGFGSRRHIRIEFHNCEPRPDADGDVTTTIADAMEFLLGGKFTALAPQRVMNRIVQAGDEPESLSARAVKISQGSEEQEG